jgi:acyl-CoA reductase-like NAD-dependent aldehyde dehydrogenase
LAISAATATEQLESFSPATGESLGAVAVTAAEEVQAVVDAVAQVQPFWAQLTLADRGRYLERTAQVLIDETDAIRDLIVREQGKPRTEAFTMELLPTIDALHWLARSGTEILADEKLDMSQLYFKTKSAAFSYEPLGVIGVISPWNYPWSIADAADRRSDRKGIRARRPTRGSFAGGARARDRRGARALERGEGVLHGIRAGRS